MTALKLLFSLPSWQKKIINQIIKEENKDKPNGELIEKALRACLKTEDENFIFSFVYYCENYDYRLEAAKFLLERNAEKWAIPCAKEITGLLGLPIVNKCLCIDAIINQGDYKTAYLFAKKFGHNEKIENFLIEGGRVDLVLDYAKNIKGANLSKIKNFVEKYVDSSTYIYKERFDEIYKNKIKRSKSLEETIKMMGEEVEK